MRLFHSFYTVAIILLLLILDPLITSMVIATYPSHLLFPITIPVSLDSRRHCCRCFHSWHCHRSITLFLVTTNKCHLVITIIDAAYNRPLPCCYRPGNLLFQWRRSRLLLYHPLGRPIHFLETCCIDACKLVVKTHANLPRDEFVQFFDVSDVWHLAQEGVGENHAFQVKRFCGDTSSSSRSTMYRNGALSTSHMWFTTIGDGG